MFDFLYISKYISIKFLHLWGLIMSCDSGRLDYSSKVLTFVVYNSGVAYMCPAGSQTRRGGSEDPPITTLIRRFFAIKLLRNAIVIIIIFAIIFFCFSLCGAQDKSVDRIYIGPSFGYASYIHTVEKPAPASDILGNYAVYRCKLNYLLGGMFGFDIGRHMVAFINFNFIYYKG